MSSDPTTHNEDQAPATWRNHARASADFLRQAMTMLEKPDCDAHRVAVQITLAILTEISDMRRTAIGPAPHQVRLHGLIIKALREMLHSVLDMEALRRGDSLSFDGPKFKHVSKTIVDWFHRAMQQAGFTDEMRNRVLREFRDIARAEEPELRREVAKMGHLTHSGR